MCVAAPAVAGLVESPINPLLHMAAGQKRRSDLDEANEFFLDCFPDNARLHIIGADQVGPPEPVPCLVFGACGQTLAEFQWCPNVVLDGYLVPPRCKVLGPSRRQAPSN